MTDDRPQDPPTVGETEEALRRRHRLLELEFGKSQ